MQILQVPKESDPPVVFAESVADRVHRFHRQLTGEVVRGRIGRMTLTTAADCNHGRGIAWAAEQLGQEAVIYMPRGTMASRPSSAKAWPILEPTPAVSLDDQVFFRHSPESFESRRVCRSPGFRVSAALRPE